LRENKKLRKNEMAEFWKRRKRREVSRKMLERASLPSHDFRAVVVNWNNLLSAKDNGRSGKIELA